MRSSGRAIGLFFVMYLVATILGFATYLLISVTVMWISVFTIMPVVAALLIGWYLLQIRCAPEGSMRETMSVVAVWIMLSFFLDAVTYIFVIPYFARTPPNWAFFIQIVRKTPSFRAGM
ncbi:MAG TPA: hypothetical protein VNW54_14790 [Granulicella sp.]|jgi:hypothetical protein|nr:hypothetical protein [Granulicella sp.]